MGMGSQVGFSYQLNKDYNISAGFSARAYQVVLLDSLARQVTIATRPSAGIFLDKQNSLMASLVWAQVPDYTWQANLYPGIIRFGKFSPGLWAVVGNSGFFAFGITSSYTFGIGLGARGKAGQ